MKNPNSGRWKAFLFLSVAIPVSFLVTYKLTGLSGNIGIGGSISVTRTHYPLELTMTLDTTELTSGERLNIELLLKNVGNETITLYFRDGNDAYDFSIYEENDTCVYRYERNTAYPQMHAPTQVKPGDIRSFMREWGQVGDAIYDPNHDPHTYYNTVPAGTYKIMGAFDSNTLGFTVDTPVISFEISG